MRTTCFSATQWWLWSCDRPLQSSYTFSYFCRSQFHLRVVAFVMWFHDFFFICGSFVRDAVTVRKRIFSLIGSWSFDECLRVFVYLSFWPCHRGIDSPLNERDFRSEQKKPIFRPNHVRFYWFVWHQSDHRRQHNRPTDHFNWNCAVLSAFANIFEPRYFSASDTSNSSALWALEKKW